MMGAQHMVKLNQQKMDGETRHNALINRLSQVIESSRRDITHPLSAVGPNREEPLQNNDDIGARIQ